MSEPKFSLSKFHVEYDDGGRAAAGYRGRAGDCVARSVAIASGVPYAQTYAALANGAGNERNSRGRSARNGIHVKRKWFRDYMMSIGFEWTPTMLVGQGCKVHLVPDELPSKGRHIIALSKHYTALVGGVLHDTHDPQREVHCIVPDHGQELRPGQWRNINGICSISRRCVYGYWTLRAVQP